MSLLITARNTDLLTTSEMLPPSLKGYEIPGSAPFIASGTFGDFIFQKLQGTYEDICIWHANYLSVQKESFLFNSTISTLVLQFNMGHAFSYEQEGMEKREIHKGSFNLFYVPFLNSQMTMLQGCRYRTFSISFGLPYLEQLIFGNLLLRNFLDKVAKGQPVLLCTVNQMTTVVMEMIIQQILGSDTKLLLRPVFLDLKVKELLLTVIDKVTHYPTIGADKIKSCDLERIHEAREALLGSIHQPLSLSELSKKIGLNIKKIKIGFKQLYEKTPFDLLLNARMEAAKRLLDGSDKSIGDIAESVGYTSTQSFSKAFKKHFGYRPLAYRKKKND